MSNSAASDHSVFEFTDFINTMMRKRVLHLPGLHDLMAGTLNQTWKIQKRNGEEFLITKINEQQCSIVPASQSEDGQLQAA